jgi:hypothetical protein
MGQIITRAQWGARYRNGFGSRRVGSLDKWLHHSVTASAGPGATLEQDAATIRALDSIGQSRFGGGISYTFAITEAGRVFEGHSVDRIGSHTKNRNTASAGIVLVGNYSTKAPTPAQIAALVWLLQYGKSVGWWQVAGLNGGHRDAVRGTECPGNVAYSMIGDINRAAGGSAVIPVSNGGGTAAPGFHGIPGVHTGRLTADGNLELVPDGLRFGATIARWQQVMGFTKPDGSISKPQRGVDPALYLMGRDQIFLNSVVDHGHILNLTGRRGLLVDADEGPATIKVRQFWLYNTLGRELLGRAPRGSDFDGIAGGETNALHQHALNRATAGSRRY